GGRAARRLRGAQHGDGGRRRAAIHVVAAVRAAAVGGVLAGRRARDAAHRRGGRRRRARRGAGRALLMRLPRSWGSYLILTTLSLQQGTQLSLLAPLLDARGYPPALIGAVVSAISVASLVARMPSGLLYRGEQARKLQAIAIPLLAVLLFLHPFATDPLVLLVIRVVDGLIYGMATTINQARFIDEQPLGPGRARAMGYYVANIAIGYSIASLLAGYVVEWAGYVPAFALGAALQLVGLLGLLDRTPLIVAHHPPIAARRGSGPVEMTGEVSRSSLELRSVLAAP